MEESLLEKLNLDQKTINSLINAQKNEISEYLLYHKIANGLKDEKNKQILKNIAEDELKHYRFLKSVTKKEVKPDRFKIFLYFWITKIFGLTFGIKLLEKGEEAAAKAYEKLGMILPEAVDIKKEEDEHEHTLLNMIKEERLEYVGSVVLGLNDALVELTGALAGLTFALQNTGLIALTGLITGIAASFSMAASEYLSTSAESSKRYAVKSSIYTGSAYIMTVFLLILPYLLMHNPFLSLLTTIITAILIIAIFNFYIAVAKDLNFIKRFTEMSAISLGVALLTFLISFGIRSFWGIEI